MDTNGNAAPTIIGLNLCHGHGNNQVTEIFLVRIYNLISMFN